jgi:hypothetical protein
MKPLGAPWRGAWAFMSQPCEPSAASRLWAWWTVVAESTFPPYPAVRSKKQLAKSRIPVQSYPTKQQPYKKISVHLCPSVVKNGCRRHPPWDFCGVSGQAGDFSD